MQKKVLLIALVVSAVLFSPFWSEPWWSSSELGLSYREARVIKAFQNVEIDRLRDAINSQIPAASAISLQDNLWKSDFLRQRFTEVFYPRRIDPQSKNQITFGPEGFQFRPETQQDVAAHEKRAPNETLEFSFFDFLKWFCVLLSASGVGFWFLRLLQIESPSFWETLPTAAFVAGALVTVSTWLQKPFLFFLFVILGLVGTCVRLFFLFRKKALELKISKSIELLIFCGFCFIFFLRSFLDPIYLWDARSVWFFRAKQIFFNGVLTLKDTLDPSLLWSHPDYPLLFPAWVNLFTSLSSVYNERMAAIGFASLTTASFVILWRYTHRIVERRAAQAFCFFTLFALEFICGGNYMDGLLALFLILGFLAFLEPEPSCRMGWVFLGCATLLKTEGLIFSFALVAAVYAWKRKLDRFTLVSTLFFLSPATFHRLWCKIQGVDSIVKGKPFSEILADFFPRALELILALPLSFQNPGALGSALVLVWGMFAAVTFVFIARKRIFKLEAPQIAFWISVLYAAFALGSLLILPEDVRWFAQVSLPRLLIAACLFSVLANIMHPEQNA